MATQFKVGDLVRRVGGKSPILVLEINGRGSGGWLYGKYCTTKNIQHRPVNAFKPFTGPLNRTQKEGLNVLLRENLGIQRNNYQEYTTETTMTKTLFQTNEDKPRVGTKIGLNREGKVVFEISGTGEIVFFESADLTEVVPYTVDIKFVTDRNSSKYSYISKEGEVDKGDIILVDGNDMARVVGVDTKSKMAIKELKGRKVLTEAFGEPTGNAQLLTETPE